MQIETFKLPSIHDSIIHLIDQNGGTFCGTQALYDAIPASPQGIRISLQRRNKYRLISAIHNRCRHGRGHKTIWKLTEKGKRYVESK